MKYLMTFSSGKRIRTTRLLAMLVLVQSLPGHAAINLYRVDADSPALAGAADGQSWATAYARLQDALAVALPGDEIWVAEGRYVPGPSESGDARRTSFVLKEAVAVYGGFTGTETTRDARDPVQHKAVLHGDLDGDDSQTDTAGRENNAYHVVELMNAASDMTRLDGFTIAGGYAVSPLFGALVYGGGIYLESATLMIADCSFTDNMAQNNGGAVYAKDSPATFTDCDFSENSSYGFGAALAVFPDDAQTRTASASITRCTFHDNRLAYALTANNSNVTLARVLFSGNEGGGLCGADRVTLNAENCVFTRNGGMNGAFYVGTRSGATLRHCTLAGNMSADAYLEAGSFPKNTLAVSNSILWNDSLPVLEYDPAGSTVTVAGSLVRGGFAGAGNLDAAPNFRSAEPPCQLSWNSPAVDACADVGVGVDIQGASRPQNDAFDMGAYEFGEDSDRGGLPDAYENDNGLIAGDAVDDTLDSDTDGLDNLEEFRRGSDPRDDLDPPHDLYVSTTGDDAGGTGAEAAPWRTIGHALAVMPEGAATFPITLHAGPGVFDEAVVLRPHVRLVGAGPAATTIQYYAAADAEHVVVRAAEDTEISECTITFPNPITATGELLRIQEVAARISKVDFSGQDSPHAIAVFVTGAASSNSVIRDCLIKRAEYGVFAVNSGINVTRNTFEDIFEIGIFIRPPDGGSASDAAAPLIGDAQQAANTGFNRFRMSDGIFIKNMTNNVARAECNDWGVYSAEAIEGRVQNSPGVVDFEPFLGKAMLRAGIAVEVTGKDTGDPIPESLNPQVTLNSTIEDRDAASSLYLFSNLEPGSYTCTAAADGYLESSGMATVAEGQIATMTLALEKASSDGETEGEGEGQIEGEKQNAFLGCGTGGTPPGGYLTDGILTALALFSLLCQAKRRTTT